MKKLAAICIMALMLTLTSAFAAEISDVVSIPSGTSRSAVHEKIGAPKSESAYGDKEIYALSGGRTAVLRYLDDCFDVGFILIK